METKRIRISKGAYGPRRIISAESDTFNFQGEFAPLNEDQIGWLAQLLVDHRHQFLSPKRTIYNDGSRVVSSRRTQKSQAKKSKHKETKR